MGTDIRSRAMTGCPGSINIIYYPINRSTKVTALAFHRSRDRIIDIEIGCRGELRISGTAIGIVAGCCIPGIESAIICGRTSHDISIGGIVAIYDVLSATELCCNRLLWHVYILPCGNTWSGREYSCLALVLGVHSSVPRNTHLRYKQWRPGNSYAVEIHIKVLVA